MQHSAFRSDSLRSRFVADDLSTASPARVVVMCFDRLDRDLQVALDAMEIDDHFVANSSLGHAQDLITELVNMLDVDAWEHAGSLMAVYDYLLRVLAAANLRKAPPLVVEARHLINELGEAFRSAAAQSPLPTATPAWPGDGGSSEPGISVQA